MSLFGGKNKQLVGLDIGSSSIKAVELKSTKAGYELVSFGTEALGARHRRGRRHHGRAASRQRHQQDFRLRKN